MIAHSAPSPNLQLIFNAAPGSLLVLAPDSPQFTIVAVTDAYLQAIGTQRSAILGRPLSEVFPDDPGELNGCAAQATRAALERALALRVPDPMALQRRDTARSQAAGGGFEARYWRAVNRPVIDASGAVAYLIHDALDVTEAERDATGRKQAEEALRESEAFGRSILKSSPDCIKVLDLDGKLLSMSSGQSLLGIEDIQPFLNRSLINFWEDANDVQAAQAAQAAIQSAAAGGAGRFVGFFSMFGGKPKWWDVAISPILDAQGQPARLLAVSRDVTERQLADYLLRERTAQFESLLNEAPLGVYLIDADFRIGHVNQMARPAFGAIADLIGRDFAEVMHVLWPSAKAEEILTQFRHTMSTGEAFVVPELIEKRADRQATEYYEWQINRILLPDGRYGVVCYFRDISERVLAQRTIRDSEERFRALVTASTDVIYRMSPDWSEMRQLLGQNFIADTTTPNGNWLHQYIDPDDRQQVLAVINEAIRTKSLFELEHRIVTADGSLGWIFSHAVPLLDASGEIVEWFGTASDVTQQRLAGQALRDSENRYRTLFNSMDEGYCIVETIFDDQNKPVDYRYLEVNPAFVAMSGMQDPSGKRIRELIPDLEEFWFETCGKVALTGEATRVVSEAKPLKRWFDVFAFRFGGSESRKVAMLFTDITERKTVEAALRQGEERFRALFDGGPIGMYSCDSAGVIQNFNRRAVELWGRQPEQGETSDRFRSAFNFYLPDGALLPLSHNPMSLILRGEVQAVQDREVIVERPDGSRIVVIVNCAALRNEQGQITGALTCFHDVTERSRLVQQTREQALALAELARRKDEFLAMLSHELRNPLASIFNAVHLLRLQQDESPVQHQARSIIERQVGQLKHLVDDLLDVSRIRTGRIQLRSEPVAVGAIVARAVETTRPLIALHRHELSVAMPPEPVWLNADAARLEQVLVNLLTNAAKYTEDGGRIRLSVEHEQHALPPMVAIKVRDTGIGIAPDLLPHIFDLFTQAERSLHRAEGGLGIGLSLVQRLVELHGGTVTASSVPGQGSDFVLRLPMLVRSATDLSVVASATLSASLRPSAPPAGNGCRVLLVDDNVDAAQTLAVLLEMSGHAVQLAYDGWSSIDAAMAYRPEVVLLDIGLPGLDGYQVAQRIRQQAELDGIVLIALTGYGRDTDRKHSQQAGFDHHLVKPASIDEIDALLCAVVAKRQFTQPVQVATMSAS